ncbi:MFS transporter [Altericroceibacterium endophyticum]|uniref:MFS transporter n=1 Tax=Altericroceibacterium endophyticum TaxID=1808508 RepID=A0A6I4T1Y3_9SPHN|nr:MFS transporter [Altericroceibacterium endophyticum]MXO65234.1 MFS transporter [Altericroceibacterium endophyticum]
MNMSRTAPAPAAAMSGVLRFITLVLIGGVMLIDGFDLNAMPLALPYLAPELELAPENFGIVFSAVLLGLGAGALLIAPLGDRFGRRTLIVGACAAIALTTFGTAFAHTVPHFALWRLATGVALGACLPNVSALSAELAPPDKRAFIMSLVSAGIAVGAMGAGLMAPELVRFGGWEMLFFTPGIFALLLAIALFFTLPKGRPNAGADTSPAGQGTDKTADGSARAPLLRLVTQPYILPFALFALIYAVNAIALYMLTSWMPTILPDAGFSKDLSSRLAGLLQGGGLVVGIAVSWLLDKWKPALAIGGTYVLVALALLAIGVVPAEPMMWGILLMIAGGGITGIHMAIMALTPSLFPSHILSSAIGAGVAIARVGAIAGPMVGEWLIKGGISTAGFFVAIAVPVAICAILSLILPRALRSSAQAKA